MRPSATPAPRDWPAGSGLNFRGVFDIASGEFVKFASGEPRTKDLSFLGPDERKKLHEDAELVQHASAPFDLDIYRGGHMTPIYFGAALKGFGVRNLLQAIGRIAPKHLRITGDVKEGDAIVFLASSGVQTVR